eukprot:TRINITY_DN68988_c0_g1_i1.p1 TRINITY_DN68988_c0_g1~~TRINITY_DN68988_c0_g1_i1.p1  ORF type:complete len:156 (-),score=22.54 TRINITY_DN68988_c0_g1_i1:160-627(-)
MGIARRSEIIVVIVIAFVEGSFATTVSHLRASTATSSAKVVPCSGGPDYFPLFEGILADVLPPPSGSAEDFGAKCVEFTKLVVAKSQGDRSKVARHMHITCGAIHDPSGVQICNAFLESLLGHLHEDKPWNIDGMDYPLFCTGMYKVAVSLEALG